VSELSVAVAAAADRSSRGQFPRRRSAQARMNGPMSAVKAAAVAVTVGERSTMEAVFGLWVFEQVVQVGQSA